MRLRSIIRTISASLTTAIIVSCTINGEPEGRQVTDYQEYEVTVASENMGEPAWTEYALIEEISKEARRRRRRRMFRTTSFRSGFSNSIVLIWMILHIKWKQRIRRQ